MGERNGSPTQPFDNVDLIALTKKPIVSVSLSDVDDEYDPLDDEWTQPGFASGSQAAGEPTRARAPTMHDPLTTGLLAEVARRSSTIELDAETLAAALNYSRRDDTDD